MCQPNDLRYELRAYNDLKRSMSLWYGKFVGTPYEQEAYALLCELEELQRNLDLFNKEGR